jgi:hypothetical protein
MDTFPATPRGDVGVGGLSGRPEMKYVLFVCTQNAGRSQTAQALFDMPP